MASAGAVEAARLILLGDGAARADVAAESLQLTGCSGGLSPTSILEGTLEPRRLTMSVDEKLRASLRASLSLPSPLGTWFSTAILPKKGSLRISPSDGRISGRCTRILRISDFALSLTATWDGKE